MVDLLIFGLLFIFGLFYALFLEVTESKWRFVTGETWLTVVLGVGVTLAFIGLFSLASTLDYWKLWAAFACAGGPVSARSVVRNFAAQQGDRQRRIQPATPED